MPRVCQSRAREMPSILVQIVMSAAANTRRQLDGRQLILLRFAIARHRRRLQAAESIEMCKRGCSDCRCLRFGSLSLFSALYFCLSVSLSLSLARSLAFLFHIVRRKHEYNMLHRKHEYNDTQCLSQINQ